jgi:hypothetical protein
MRPKNTLAEHFMLPDSALVSFTFVRERAWDAKWVMSSLSRSSDSITANF